MNRKGAFLVLALVVGLGCIFFLYMYSKEKTFITTAKVTEVSDFYDSSALLENGKKVTIHSNLIEENEIIKVEGYMKSGNYIITKIFKNFETEDEKKKFIKEKLYANISMKNYTNYLQFENGTIIGVLPLQIQKQVYENMIEPIDYINVYKTMTALPISNQSEKYILKKRRDMQVLSVYGFSENQKEKIDFYETDELIEYPNSNQYYYSVVIAIDDDIVEFLVI